MSSYQMKVEKGITVRMRDGVRISLCVYRPDAAGRFPALFAASPYQYEMDDVPAYPLFLWRETGPVEWYVGQGYAYVHADVRGSGRSEGEFEFMGLNEQQDYLELIDWIVQQPWCNGRVGGIGQSYYAMAQWLMATYNPPGLACIAPYDGLVDQYRGSNYHGGIYCSLSLGLVHVAARRQSAPPRRPARPAADEIRSGRRHHRPSARRRILASAFALLAARQDQVPGAVDRTLGQDGSAPARQHPRLRGGQSAEEARGHRRPQHLRSAPDVRPGRISRKGTAAVLRSASQGRKQRLHGHRAGEAVRARRQCLAHRGGMAAEARDVPLRTISRKGPSGSVTSLNDGGLSTEKPAADEAATSYTYPDWEWVNGVAVIGPDGRVDPARRVLTFTSAPLEADLEVTGPIVLKLYASSTAIDTQFIVKLTDQHPQDCGRASRRRAAGLYAGVEGLAEGLASREGCGALEAGAAILHPHQPAAARARRRSMSSTSRCCRSPTCSRRATASGSSSPTATLPATDGVFSHPYHPSLMGTDTIHHDGAHASCLILPRIAAD